ncbi:hypothetical protein [Gaetbulibacter sp. PBL-D1]|uniref:hypothetical protein n=1 Tax=Gaetbulibacter sp. PBL-D1 TaxID=3422594 RepID=UPI003D2F09BD
MTELKSIKPEIGFKFQANGKNYIIEDKLSIARHIEASKLELHLFEMSSSVIKSRLISAYNDLNGSNKDKTVKFADAATKIHNLVNNLEQNLNFKDLPILNYCALYINSEDEDRRTISKERIQEKVNDWQEAGFEISGFFLLVLSVLPHVKKDFVKYMEDISKISKTQIKKEPKSKQ